MTQFHNTNIMSGSILAFFSLASPSVQPLKKDKIQKLEILKLHTQAIHNLGELVQLKTK